MTTTNRRRILIGGAAVVAATPFRADAAGSISDVASVLASSDLGQVLPDILRAYDTQGGAVGIDYRSAADIDRHLRQGARSDLVLGADETSMLRLAEDGLLIDAGTPLAEGRLALVVNRRSPLADDISLGAIAEAARDGAPFRIALADPESTPYGGRATDVLERWGVEQLLRPRFVYTEDVAEAVRLVTAGQVAVGLVPKSLTAAPGVARAIHVVDIPHGWHRPLVQRMALARGASMQALRFHAFLKAEPAQKLLARYGYAVPARGD